MTTVSQNPDDFKTLIWKHKDDEWKKLSTNAGLGSILYKHSSILEFLLRRDRNNTVKLNDIYVCFKVIVFNLTNFISIPFLYHVGVIKQCFVGDYLQIGPFDSTKCVEKVSKESSVWNLANINHYKKFMISISQDRQSVF